MSRLLVVTNDFPPRPGGIQSFVGGVVSRLDPREVVVLTSSWRGASDWDAQQAYRIVRQPTSVLLPTPATRRAAQRLVDETGCTDAWFGAAAPLGLLAPALRRAGVGRIVATTHGHEAGWARLPVARRLLRRVARNVDALTYLGEFTRVPLAAALGGYADRLTRLAPGVDTETFAPVDGVSTSMRAQLGLTDEPVVVCVSRLMPRKGQDLLIEALSDLRRRVPRVRLLLVGGGPARRDLQRLAANRGVGDAVVFTGSVPQEQLPAYFRSGDVFAMPCRSRLGGLDVEGLGIVFLEASASGLPVVVGDSGGAPDAVIDGETGHLVAARSSVAVATALGDVLSDRSAALAMGQRGREWVREHWSWEATMRAFAAAFTATGRPAG